MSNEMDDLETSVIESSQEVPPKKKKKSELSQDIFANEDEDDEMEDQNGEDEKEDECLLEDDEEDECFLEEKKEDSSDDDKFDDEEVKMKKEKLAATKPKKSFSSQDADAMKKARFDTSTTPAMKASSIRLLKLLDETEDQEHVYLICDGDRILYVGKSSNVAMRLYMHLYKKKGPINEYMESHPAADITSIPIFPNGTRSDKARMTEALIIELQKEMDLELISTLDDEEEAVLDGSMRNERSERLPESLKAQLGNEEKREMIIDGLKFLIRNAVKEGRRFTKDDALEAMKEHNKKLRNKSDYREKENARLSKSLQRRRAIPENLDEERATERENYAHKEGDDAWPNSLTQIIDEEETESGPSPPLRRLLRGITPEDFANQVRGPCSAHKFAAKYRYIVNERTCQKKNCCKQMLFTKKGVKCGFVWRCREKGGKSKMCSSVPCCHESIFMPLSKPLGGLYTILQMLHMLANEKTEDEVVEAFAAQMIKDKRGKFKLLNALL